MSSTVEARDLLAQLLRGWCREHLRVESVEAAEQEAVALMRQRGAIIVGEGLGQIAGKATYEGCSVACQCGQRAKFKGYRQRWLTTLAGSVRVARAY